MSIELRPVESVPPNPTPLSGGMSRPAGNTETNNRCPEWSHVLTEPEDGSYVFPNFLLHDAVRPSTNDEHPGPLAMAS